MDRGVTVASSRIERWQLRRGDHIYTWREDSAYAYSHHGIYESDKKVIHYTRASVGSSSAVGSSSFRLFSSFAPAPTCRDCAEAERKGGVIISCLECFLQGGNICLFAYSVPEWFRMSDIVIPHPQNTCTTLPEDPAEMVLHRANYMLADGFGSYDVVDNNCFHFAFYCKTGRRLMSFREKVDTVERRITQSCIVM